MWANFHTHSTYCDGKNSLQEIAVAATKRDVSILGFSSHAPLPFDSPWCMKKENLAAYIQEIENLRKDHTDIEIYKGLEVDYIPNLISPKDFNDQLDYTIGSVHFVESLNTNQRWEIDGIHPLFLEGLSSIFKNNIEDVIHRYFELTRAMMETSPPDIVGHLDKIKIQNIEDKFFRESDFWYRQEILHTLDTIKQTGLIVEVNTRGVYQKKSSTTYPSPWVLEHILEMGIPITISSDAHHESDLTNQFYQTASLLQKLGFRKVRVLLDGTWRDVPFDEKGIYFS